MGHSMGHENSVFKVKGETDDVAPGRALTQRALLAGLWLCLVLKKGKMMGIVSHFTIQKGASVREEGPLPPTLMT